MLRAGFDTGCWPRICPPMELNQGYCQPLWPLSYPTTYSTAFPSTPPQPNRFTMCRHGSKLGFEDRSANPTRDEQIRVVFACVLLGLVAHEGGDGLP